MARRRFFVSSVRRGTAQLTGDDAAHLVRVLRVEPGQVFEISDNSRVYLAEVETARKSEVVFRIKEELPATSPGIAITICPALIKFDHFEWLVEKATELGVTRIQPFAAVRSEHGLLSAAPKRLERWRKIAVEASQQSRRTLLPEIDDAVRSIEEITSNAPIKLLLDEENQTPILAALPGRVAETDSVAILLGPEGGWTDNERGFALANNWTPCSLGNTILRAETAAIASLAIVQAACAQAETAVRRGS
jgi:16S rRNA (uracil1498-N3)-methyltransferase